MVFEDHKDGCSDSQAGGGECQTHLQVRDGGGHSVLCQVVQERAGVLQVRLRDQRSPALSDLYQVCAKRPTEAADLPPGWNQGGGERK